MKTIKSIILVLLAVIIVEGCKKDDDSKTTTVAQQGEILVEYRATVSQQDTAWLKSKLTYKTKSGYAAFTDKPILSNDFFIYRAKVNLHDTSYACYHLDALTNAKKVSLVIQLPDTFLEDSRETFFKPNSCTSKPIGQL